MIGSRSSLLGLVLLFAACGSNSEDPELPDIERPAETSGSFYDSVVIGLEYDADFGSGVTDDSGFFDIELGQTVTLSIGAVELGDVSASAIMTPLGLVADSDAMAASVVNRVRFLLALDVDGDPTTGIQIAPALRELADVWSVDFEVSTDDFAGQVAAELADATTVNTVPASLPVAADATAHLERTILCAYSGLFTGTLTSEDSGLERVLTLVVPADSNEVRGVQSKIDAGDFRELSGERSLASDRSLTASDDDYSLVGAFASAHWIEGSWEEQDDAGSFALARVGYQDDARWRFTGVTSVGEELAIDIDAGGNLTGVIRLVPGSALASAPITGTFREGTGQFSANAMVPLGDRELQGSISFDGSPTIEGTVFPNGTFRATGCRLR